MPLTRPDNFKAHAPIAGERRDSIVTVSDGTTTWYFSRKPIPGGFGGVQVHPLLLDHSDVVDAMDWIGKSMVAGNVSITLTNAPQYPSNASAPVRVSDLLNAVSGGELKIYFIVGDSISSLDDCLLVFSGYVTDAPKYDLKTLTISASSKGRLLNTKLPLLKVSDKWGAAPAKSLAQPIPIVYGIWDKPDLYGDDADGTGMFRGVIVEDDQTPIYLIADHECDIVDSVHVSLADELIAIHWASDAYNEAQGHFVVGNITICYLDFPLSSTLPGIYDNEVYLANDPENAHDGNTGTQAQINDNARDAGLPYGPVKGQGAWAIENDLAFRKYLATGNPHIKVGYQNIHFDAKDANPNISNFMLGVALCYYYNGEDHYVWVGAIDTIPEFDAIVFDSSTIAWLPAYNDNYITFTDLGEDLSNKFLIPFTLNFDWEGCDGIMNNQSLFRIGELFLRLNFTIDDTKEHCWSSGSGKMFGSWIDAGGRDNGFDEGGVISDPAMIVEDLFRSYLGLATADIDTTSFDAAINTDVDMRVNVFKPVDAFSSIQKLCEQSTFAIFYSAAGKLTAVPLNDTDPNVNEVIRLEEIVAGALSISKTSDIVNKMTVESRYKAHNNVFYDSDLFEDPQSQAELGERPATYKWECLVGNSVDKVAAVYVADSKGIWSQQHVQVSFTVSGYSMSHLQAGDWISLHMDVDEVCKPYGDTWNGKKLLVLEARKGISGTTIKAIELYSPRIMDTLSLALSAQTLTVVPGEMPIQMSPATAALSASTLTVTPGPIFIQMSPATLTSSTETLTVSTPKR